MTCPSGRVVTVPGIFGYPVCAISPSTWRSWRRLLITGHMPAPHSSAAAGESAGMPLAPVSAATQRGATARKSRMSLSRMTMRSLTASATQAFLWACKSCNAASISSCDDGEILLVAVGNWGEPCLMSMVMVAILLFTPAMYAWYAGDANGINVACTANYTICWVSFAGDYRKVMQVDYTIPQKL